MRSAVLALLLLPCVFGSANAEDAPPPPAKPPLLMATITAPGGIERGTARIETDADPLSLEVSMFGLDAGRRYTVRLHGVGLCDSAEGFGAAGPVLKVFAKPPAGLEVPPGAPDVGPPVIQADAKGEALIYLKLPGASLRSGVPDKQPLIDADGVSVVLRGLAAPDATESVYCGLFIEAAR